MNYKSDSRRLLKMLEQTEEYKYFAKMALDDEGVRHLGMTGKKSKLDLTDPTNNK
jgi:phosphorylcholine metabolism protein LicD